MHDYSILDRPEITNFIFYPRKEWSPPPEGAHDFLVSVEDQVSVSCRFYPFSPEAPCILYFHGNGEIACDYDEVAPLYNAQGISLFVADYRGYGLSGGRPSFSNMMNDAVSIYDFFCKHVIVNEKTPLFIMGRSMGANSATVLASRYAHRFKGLIVESGFAIFSGLLSRWFGPIPPGELKRINDLALARIKSITLPVLLIHGECDEIIPFSAATTFYDEVGSIDKRLVMIPDATHNDIMIVGLHQYFLEIKEFIFQQPME